MALKTVKQACQLAPNALDIRVSDQIEQLDELIREEGGGETFFERTFITEGMETLFKEGVARLAGRSSSGVFHLKQAMGGGKTHLLVGFGLLARNPALRKKVIPHVSYIDAFGNSRVAAFNGRNHPNEFFWGEIAKQLGKGEAFAQFWNAGPKAPSESDWLKLFESAEPTLILLDELPPYFHYYATQQVGQGTIADVATRAFANMLSAAGKKANVCVVVSDLAAAYDTGTSLINKALDDARSETGRQEKTITPVDLAKNEIYDILRKRLFKSTATTSEVDEVAVVFGEALQEATRARVASRGAEALAEEVASTYPFHPRLKDLIALFKENEKFKQTRGLMELASRLLRSVWERKDDDVYLIGAQHFDLSIADVRDKLTDISEMRDVVSKDLWDDNGAAHAQVLDAQRASDAASQVGTLLLTASLSTAVNAVKGVTKEDLVECLIAPHRKPSEFLEAFEQLEGEAWYLHHSTDGKFYFDRQENLTKLLKDLADKAPQNKIEELISKRLTEMYKPTRKVAYDAVLPLPKIDEVADHVRKGRVLLIVTPDSKLPPEAVQKLFAEIAHKNNLCVLTGDKTAMASLEKAARQLFAALQADTRIAKGHPQRDELQGKQESYQQDFQSTVLSIFNRVVFPIQPKGQPAKLASKPLDLTRDPGKSFDGEAQIEQTLVSDPKKLFIDPEADADSIRIKAQDLLWQANASEVRWSDALYEAECAPGMPWMPPKGLDRVKAIACNKGSWEDLGNGYVTKSPAKKKTTVQVVAEGEPDDDGNVRLRVNAQNAGAAPKIHYAVDGKVTDRSPVLDDVSFTTKAMHVHFLAVDPSGKFETGDPVSWKNRLVVRNELIEDGAGRRVRIYVAPKADKVRFSLDGREPRDGTEYTEPIVIGNSEARVLVYAEAAGVETKANFDFPKKGTKGVQINPAKPAVATKSKGMHKLDSRGNAFGAVEVAKANGIRFESLNIVVGSGAASANVTVTEMPITGEYLEKVLIAVTEAFPPDAPITLSFKKAHFNTGHDLEQFASKFNIELQPGEVTQEVTR
jgi:hypothetical protein